LTITKFRIKNPGFKKIRVKTNPGLDKFRVKTNPGLDKFRV